MNKLNQIGLLIPVYNEESNLLHLVADLKKTFEGRQIKILLIDDGSSDNSLEIISNLAQIDQDIKYLSFSRNYGKEIAIQAGMKAFAGNVDAVIIMDSDGQHRPEDALRMVFTAEEGNYDIVFGARSKRDYQNKTASIASRVFYSFFNTISSINLDSAIGDFNLLRSNAVLAVASFNEKNLFMKGVYSYIGFRSTKIEISISQRVSGVSKYNWSRKISLAVTGITAFSLKPLRTISIIGFSTFILSLLLIAGVILQYFIKGVFFPGYYTILVLLLFFFGLNMLFIGILGEYIGRIHDETRHRPLFIFRETSPGYSNLANNLISSKQTHTDESELKV